MTTLRTAALLAITFASFWPASGYAGSPARRDAQRKASLLATRTGRDALFAGRVPGVVKVEDRGHQITVNFANGTEATYHPHHYEHAPSISVVTPTKSGKTTRKFELRADKPYLVAPLTRTEPSR